jgi:hypothetical protein
VRHSLMAALAKEEGGVVPGAMSAGAAARVWVSGVEGIVCVCVCGGGGRVVMLMGGWCQELSLRIKVTDFLAPFHPLSLMCPRAHAHAYTHTHAHTHAHMHAHNYAVMCSPIPEADRGICVRIGAGGVCIPGPFVGAGN